MIKIVANDFIEPWIQTEEKNCQNIVNWLAIMNFKGGIFENLPLEVLNKSTDQFDKETNFLIFNRKTIESSKRNHSEMDKFRNDFDFIVYLCSNAELTKLACQYQRIDCLTFRLSGIHQLVDDSTINLALEQDKAIEIDYSEILTKKNPIPLLRNIKKVIYKATKKNLPIIFSSRAENKYDLRSSHSLLGFLGFIDVKKVYYMNISQSWLLNRLQRNRLRKKGEFLSPGIWLKNKESEF